MAGATSGVGTDGGVAPTGVTMRFGRRTVLALVLVVAMVVLGVVTPTAPAGADPARPTNDRAEVIALEPASDGVRVDVIGGDAFLRVRAGAGRSVAIPGYEGEPYLRIGADGSVERNRRAPATWLNSTRYGPTDAAPADADAAAAPEWETIASGGQYVWHDHRIHAMGGEPQQTWEVPLVVDDTPVIVRGALIRLPAPNPWPWRALALGLGAIVLVALARVARAGSALVAAVAVAAIVVGVAEARALPGEAGGGTTAVALPAIAAIAAAAAVLLAQVTRRHPWVAAPLTAGAGVALVVWSWPRLRTLDHAVLLTVLPDALERTIVAGALGVGVAALVAGLAATLMGPGWVRLGRLRSRRAMPA